MRNWSLALIVLMVLFILAACSKDPDSTKGEDGDEALIYPLTGLEADRGANNRAVAIMVNNHISARPHAGISKADIVYEVLAEGDITRFMAVYQSEQPEVVGSIRSAREYYLELAEGLDAIYVYHGAAKYVDKMIKDSGIDYINGAKHDNDGVLFKRESFRKAPHNSFFQFNGLEQAINDEGFAEKKSIKPLLFIQDGEEVSGSDATHIKVTYGTDEAFNPEYRYNKETKLYTRVVNGEATKELNSSESVEVANVFVLETAHEVFDNEGRRHVDLKSGGSAYLFQEGKMQAVEWKNKDGRIIPVKDGKEIGFVPGKTWINIIPNEPGIDNVVNVANE